MRNQVSWVLDFFETSMSSFVSQKYFYIFIYLFWSKPDLTLYTDSLALKRDLINQTRSMFSVSRVCSEVSISEQILVPSDMKGSKGTPWMFQSKFCFRMQEMAYYGRKWHYRLHAHWAVHVTPINKASSPAAEQQQSELHLVIWKL